jgi:glycosyltransferase involved in cell wall biosynthesis
MKIIQVVAGINNLSAGPSYTVPRLCEGLAQRNCHVDLHVLEPLPKIQTEREYGIHAYPVTRIPVLDRFGLSPAMRTGLACAAENADLIHSHGLWLMPNVYAHDAARRMGVRSVLSPRGMLSAWALGHSRWKKALVWRWWQKSTLETVSCFHATAESELDDIRKLGFKAPVAVIPNGIDVPAEQPASSRGSRRLLFLARIHAKKGVDILLRAWSKLENRHADWVLTIAGPDDGGYLEEMKRLASALRLAKVDFIGPVYGEEKRKLYFSSDLYVLPTHSENFGISVAEALAHGVPAVVTRGAPWGGIEDRECGWWINLSEESLTACLDQALSVGHSDLNAMGERGRRWMLEEYSWSSVAEKMHQTYNWILSGGTPPSWVSCA